MARKPHLGQKTLLAVYRAELGIEPPTALAQRVLDFFGASSIEEILRRFHNRQHAAWENIGDLAPILLDEADAGDLVALRVVQEHGAGLGSIAQVAMLKMGLENTAYSTCAGGRCFPVIQQLSLRMLLLPHIVRARRICALFAARPSRSLGCCYRR